MDTAGLQSKLFLTGYPFMKHAQLISALNVLQF